MTRVPEFHTIFPRTDGAPIVYHDQSGCLAGKSVKPEHRRYGSWGWAKCQTCQKLGVELTSVACVETLSLAEESNWLSRAIPLLGRWTRSRATPSSR